MCVSHGTGCADDMCTWGESQTDCGCYAVRDAATAGSRTKICYLANTVLAFNAV